MYLSHTHKSNFHSTTLAFNTINAKLHASSNLENTSTRFNNTGTYSFTYQSMSAYYSKVFLGAGQIVGQL